MSVLQAPTDSANARNQRCMLSAVSKLPQLSLKISTPSQELSCRRSSLECPSKVISVETLTIHTGASLACYYRENVTVKGVRWAYRTNLDDPNELHKDKRPVLLLHGLGSASFSYR